MPHVPSYTAPRFRGKIEHGLYDDTVEEMDYYGGRLLDHLKDLGTEKNTLVIFTPDGSWKLSGRRSGITLPTERSKVFDLRRWASGAMRDVVARNYTCPHGFRGGYNHPLISYQIELWLERTSLHYSRLGWMEYANMKSFFYWSKKNIGSQNGKLEIADSNRSKIQGTG